jgi:hypothetical protein
MNTKTIINQTLHGYSNGHHLLASSMNLSDASKRKMDILSDLSGPDMTEGFDGYFSGYFLEPEQLIVLAKTWYASEMIRPGCVWTHSFLFRLDDVDTILQCLDYLVDSFMRPSAGECYNSYTSPLAVDSMIGLSKEMDRKKLQYLIWVILGHKAPNMIISQNSAEYINELLFLWLTCYKELPQGYSFITGAMSIRSDNEKIICLQFVPRGFRNKVCHSGLSVSVMKNIDEVQKFPPWVSFACDIITNNRWSLFVVFRSFFGSDYNNFEYLTPFIKFYSVFCGKNGFLNIYDSMELIDKLFLTDKMVVGNKLFQLYFEDAFTLWGEKISYTNTIIATLKFEWLSLNEDKLRLLISNGFAEEKDGAKRVVQHLANIENNEIQEQYLSLYANLLNADILEQFSGMDYSICSVLVTLNPSLAECISIWRQPKGYQKGILDSLKICKNSNSLSIKIAYIILDNSLHDFAYEIFALWGKLAINVFLEYLLQFRTLPHADIQSMFILCKAHSGIAALMLEEQYNRLAGQQIEILFNIIDPYIDKVRFKTLIEIFEMLNITELNNKQKDILADFYFPIILKSNRCFPNDFVVFTVNNIHDRLANLTYPEDKWQKLKALLPEVPWLNQWDKCKRVRKAIKKKGYNVKEFNLYNDDKLNLHLFKLWK